MFKSAMAKCTPTLILLLVLSTSVRATQNQAVRGEKVAVVNGAAIYAGEFDAALQQARQQQTGDPGMMTMGKLRLLRKEVLENLIGRRLAYQESQRLGVQVESALVDRELERIYARLPDTVAPEEVLGKVDLSETRLRLQLKKDIAIRALLEARIIRNIEVSDRDVRDFYDNHPNLFKIPALVKASHIFIAVGPESSKAERAEAVTLLRRIREKVDQGAEFSEMAIDYSQCPSRENGGDLGYFEKEKMIKGFAEAAFALHPGEVSEIVRTGRGYHLIRVEDRKPKTKRPFGDVKAQLLKRIKFLKAAREIKAYLKTLRDAAEVEILIRL